MSREAGPDPKQSRLDIHCQSTRLAMLKFPIERLHNFLPITSISSPESEKASKDAIPSSVQASSQWALRNFTKWAMTRSSPVPDDPVPKDLMASSILI